MRKSFVKKIFIIICISFVCINLIGKNISFADDSVDYSEYGIEGSDSVTAYHKATQQGYTGTQEEYTEYFNAVTDGDYEDTIDQWTTDKNDTGSDENDDTDNGKGTNEPTDGTSAAAIIKIIRQSVAKWYYIMRLIVVAFMLVLLIFVGIKMALSTIASEKAVYKQMLVDWIAGMIIVFSIHYIMIFILTVNDNIVSSLEVLVTDGSSTVTDIQEEYQYGDEKNQKTTAEIETSLYETVRTRAYSVKLTDGFMGMIFYGVLVYYAWRFALMYFRRVINIIILTLMAPVVSASYAFNKVLTGKSMIFTTWLTEYIMNVIIQIVHVIIYVSFVSTAFALSLTSLSGAVLALVLLNFMTKADKLLRQLFKLSGGQGSLAGDMSSTSFGKIRSEMKTTANAMVGGKLTKAAIGTTYRVASKPLRKTGEVAFGTTMSIIGNHANHEKEEQQQREKEQKIMEDYNEFANAKEIEKEHEKIEETLAQQYEIQANLAREKEELRRNGTPDEIRQNEENLKAVKEAIEESEQKRQELEMKEQILQDAFLQNYQNSATVSEVLKGNVKDLFNYKNYTEKDEGGKYRRIKNWRKGEDPNNRNLFKKRMLWRKKQDGIGVRFLNNAKFNKMLGISDQESKILKEEAKFWKSTITGVMAAMAGLPALAINPLLGLGLLADAKVSRSKVKERRAKLKNRPAPRTDKEYKFKNFSKETQKHINDELMAQIETAEHKLAQKNMKRHKKVLNKVINNTQFIVKPIAIGTVAVSGICFGLPMVGVKDKYEQPSVAGKRFSIKAKDFTAFEQDRLKTINEKQAREAFKEAKKAIAYGTAKELEKDFIEKLDEVRNDAEEEAKRKTSEELLSEEMLSEDNTAKIGREIIKIDSDDSLEQLVKEANTIDSEEGISREEKISQINDAIQVNQTELVKAAITKVCVDKGISDISRLKMNDTQVVEVKKVITSTLETKGIIEKGEITLDEATVSSDSISQVYTDMTRSHETQKEANEEIEKKVVESAYLEYMVKTGITDKKELKKDEAKDGIYDIIVDKLMTDDEKQVDRVIEDLQGESIKREEYKMRLSQNVKDQMEQVLTRVNKKTEIVLTDINLEEKDKLVSREKRRKINETKTNLETAICSGEDDNIEDDKQLEMLFLLSEIGKQNVEAKKVGDKSKVVSREKLKELRYYQENTSAPQEDITTKIYGPTSDIIELINKGRTE